jgi:hypothetical protein
MLIRRPMHDDHGPIGQIKKFYEDCPACNMNRSYGEWHIKEYATKEETRYMQDLAKRVYLHGPWNNDGTLNMNVVKKEGC